MNRVLIPLTLDPVSLPAHAIGAEVHALHGETMGTTWSVKLVAVEADLPRLNTGVQAQLDRVVSQMSHWEPQSDLCAYNSAVAGTWVTLPKEFFEVLSAAYAHAAESSGAFDPTIGPLVDVWGFGPAPRRSAPPSDSEIATARARVGWQQLQLDKEQRRALQPGGVQLDFSSIAKGYSVDLIARFLQGAGIDHWMVEVGGELRGNGCKPDGQPWWVELEQLSAKLPRTVLALHGLSVASSGDYRRFFEFEGQRYAHTLDPRSGRPVTHALASVTVLHAECMQADALATLLGVLSPTEAYEYAYSCDIAALFVLRNGDKFEERMTPAFEALSDE
ncbi:FAD:protein FMN transferase [Stenotrophobium rhamnosiphilum]|uniref:FAD:protein FMN transferase n=1 Tax=Stenotrophobium rhamnosiphilum TaxID=2029166 RepID=A0A2T5MKU4_9GAMM|nr:FAD:protein FMN transferase [Stenotrophobium rhamnosiphilum]PTU33196.1 thiamine biosynthesis protein ApbE [Stenotrophobium rhamnosiphilum]